MLGVLIAIPIATRQSAKSAVSPSQIWWSKPSEQNGMANVSAAWYVGIFPTSSKIADTDIEM